MFSFVGSLVAATVVILGVLVARSLTVDE